MKHEKNSDQQLQECVEVANVNLLPWWGHPLGWVLAGGISAGLVFGKVIDLDWLAWHSALLCGIILVELVFALINLLIIMRWRANSSWQEQANKALNNFMHVSDSPLTFVGARDAAQLVIDPISQSVNRRFLALAIFSMILCVPMCGSFVYTVSRQGKEIDNLQHFLLPTIALFCTSALTMLVSTCGMLVAGPVLTSFQTNFANQRATEVGQRLKREEEHAPWNREPEPALERNVDIEDHVDSEYASGENQNESPEKESEAESFANSDSDEAVDNDEIDSKPNEKRAESGMWDE